MRIHVVNPNSSMGMTQQIGRVARQVASTGTTIDLTRGVAAPASIEGYTDEALCVPPMLEQIRAAEARGADAHVIACFDDPGIGAAREVAVKPVIGICEASVRVALLLSSRFSVVTTLPRSIPIIEDLVDGYGAGRRCRNVRAINLPVLAVEEDQSAANTLLAAEIMAAKREDRAEAIILGCAGMSELCNSLTATTGVLVIDGVTAAVRLAEAVAGTGYVTSKLGGYAAPLEKAGGFGRDASDELRALSN
ncbi:aspartate/glutamate racemase family protein [Aquicoccus porphyridii]|uniref:Hydantoin racemase n=1 Tax=Aquicoccus porphyridii TaxID=1852029 RepID=A0A5A9ZG68_9RHOB|nr:aspartate/glutamate racemase family protein [Aquicoccus porphyridii]KAA0916026.1 aspartate/glutamate racemase family protein [Aquicoccus porphyridii]RAI52667.1 aspartate/glutamate racemase family protein [Rhodobacteraceae bacterium AsT-22]